MHADLERLIRLQHLDSFTEHARRTIADLPARILALDARLASARDALETARRRLEANQATRRTADRDLAMVQSRLAKFRDQVMEVKTNKEYQAMQKEIEMALQEVRQLEDRILERMIEADEIQAAVRAAGAGLVADTAAVDAERRALEDEARALECETERAAESRRALVAELPAQALSTFDLLTRHRGVAVAEARDGHCTLCHVRLRPQVYNQIRRNDAILQCDSCQRILYFKDDAAPEPAAT